LCDGDTNFFILFFLEPAMVSCGTVQSRRRGELDDTWSELLHANSMDQKRIGYKQDLILSTQGVQPTTTKTIAKKYCIRSRMHADVLAAQ
jgi:hypothetical protein